MQHFNDKMKRMRLKSIGMKMSQIVILFDRLISIHDSYLFFCIAKDTTAKNPAKQRNRQQMILMQF